MNRAEASNSFSPLVLENLLVERIQISTGIMQIRISVMELGRFTRSNRALRSRGANRLSSPEFAKATEDRVPVTQAYYRPAPPVRTPHRPTSPSGKRIPWSSTAHDRADLLDLASLTAFRGPTAAVSIRFLPVRFALYKASSACRSTSSI